MNKSMFFRALALTVAAASFNAYSAPAPTHYTAESTELGTLLADPAAKAIVEKKFPLLAESSAVASGMANGMTLIQLQKFKPEIFTDAALKDADAEFAKLPAK